MTTPALVVPDKTRSGLLPRSATSAWDDPEIARKLKNKERNAKKKRKKKTRSSILSCVSRKDHGSISSQSSSDSSEQPSDCSKQLDFHKGEEC